MTFRNNIIDEDDLELISKENQSQEITDMLEIMDIISDSENSLQTQSEANFR